MASIERLTAAFKRLLASSGVRVAAGLLISGIALYLAFREVSLEQVGRALASADWRFVALTLISVLAGIALKALRWYHLLGPDRGLTGFRRTLAALLAAQMLNALIPARVGDVSRLYLIGPVPQGKAFILGTIVLEKTADLVAYAALFAVLLLSLPLPAWIGGSAYTLVLAALFAGLLIAFAVLQRERLARSLPGLIERILPQRFGAYLAGRSRAALESLSVIGSGTDLFLLVILTTVIWAAALLNPWLALQAFDLQLPLTASLLLLIALQAGISLPSVPGYLGVFEYICVLSLGVFGVEPAVALGYGLLLHAVVFLPPVLLGLLSFWLLGAGPAALTRSDPFPS